MAIDWAAAATMLAKAAIALGDYLRDRDDETRREQERQEMLAAIRDVREQIMSQLIESELNELRGALEGFEDTYNANDPDPNDSVEENRLARLIDDSAGVIGRLGNIIENVGSNEELAFDAWPIYLPLIYLRAQAMTERQITYDTSEATDALLSMDTALPRLKGLLDHLRRQSDSRFGPIVCRSHPDYPQGIRICWYTLRTANTVADFVCGSTADPQSVSRCQRMRSQHMDGVYAVTPGVAEISASVVDLQAARDTLDTIGVIRLLMPVDPDLASVLTAMANDGKLRNSARLGRLETFFL